MLTITQILKEKNLKLTPQRLSIYNMLYNTTEHPTVDTIYKSLIEQNPTMSLATVYKNLDSLKKVGLVTELNIGEDSFRYDANCQSHMHFYCNSCKQVLDVPHTDLINPLKDEIENTLDFDIDREQLFFYGTCSKCKNASQAI